VDTSGFAQGFERLERAGHGIPDRVPVTAQMHEFSLAWTGSTPQRFYTEPHLLVDAIVQTAADFGFDVPSLSYDVYNIELEALGHPVRFPARSAPVLDPQRVLLADEGELQRLNLAEPGRSGRMPFVLEVRRLFLEATGVAPAIQFCAPFSLAAQARGYERFVQDICGDPGFARELMRVLTEEVIAPWINAQALAMPAANLALGADALCSPPMTNRAILEEFAIPWILRLRELCPLPVAVVNWWGDSCFEPLGDFLQLKRRVCAGLIRAQDPDVARLGAGVFKQFAVRHGLTLELGVGDVLLNQGPIEGIRQRIHGYLEEAAPGGRLILYLASLNAETPPEHVRAALGAVREFGAYV
jgi:hypothetical protein